MMSSETCEALRDDLVDYADGELEAEKVAAIETHLRDCPSCRRLLSALRASLSAARQIWTDGGSEPVSLPTAPARRSSPLRFRRLAWSCGAAAAILFALAYSASSLRWTAVKPSESSGVAAERVEREILDSGLAQEMLLVGQMLAQTPGGETYARDRFRFITEQYPATDAAREARACLAANSGKG